MIPRRFTLATFALIITLAIAAGIFLRQEPAATSPPQYDVTIEGSWTWSFDPPKSETPTIGFDWSSWNYTEGPLDWSFGRVEYDGSSGGWKWGNCGCSKLTHAPAWPLYLTIAMAMTLLASTLVWWRDFVTHVCTCCGAARDAYNEGAFDDDNTPRGPLDRTRAGLSALLQFFILFTGPPADLVKHWSAR